jgi:hypothetical protein
VRHWRQLPAFAEAANVRAGSKLHILAPQGSDLAISKTGLEREQQKCSITSADPGVCIRSRQYCGTLFLGKKLH